MTSAAPWMRAAATASAPMGPQPETSTRLPSKAARCTPCSATEKRLGHAACCSGTWRGHRFRTARRRTSRLRKAPDMRVAHGAAVEAHVQAPVGQASRQYLHAAAGRLGFTATRLSPGFTRVDPGATAVTVPATSWPRIIGRLMRTVPKPPCVEVVQVGP